MSADYEAIRNSMLTLAQSQWRLEEAEEEMATAVKAETDRRNEAFRRDQQQSAQSLAAKDKLVAHASSLAKDADVETSAVGDASVPSSEELQNSLEAAELRWVSVKTLAIAEKDRQDFSKSALTRDLKFWFWTALGAASVLTPTIAALIY